MVWTDIVELVHERKKSLKCDICDYGFYQRVTWYSMLQQFMKDKNYLNATFVTTNVHEKTHIASVHEKRRNLIATFVTTDVLEIVT